MPIDAKHEELRSLRIERSQPPTEGGPPAWARRYIVIGIAIVVVLSAAAGAYRLFAGDAPEVQVTRATFERIDVDFVCEPQGVAEIKGKGPMPVWHVTGRRDVTEPSPTV